MAKGINQKLKLLYIVKILSEKTDERHPMPMSVLINELAKYEVSAERKSIYDDVIQLNEFGFDIGFDSARKTGGYYMASHDLELTELKLLVDSVQASRFITLKKSRELISKLEKMCSMHDAKELKRSVYVQNRVKTDNESIYYVVNDIYTAININKKISFVYYDWDINKKKVARKNGERYLVSPFAMTLKDENYYLIAYNDQYKEIRHYRVDKIKDVNIECCDREGNEEFKSFDVATYTNKSFGMYHGKDEKITLRFPEQYVGIVIDRFGTEIDLRKDEEMVLARTEVSVSNQFFGWVSSIGPELEIIGPKSVRDEYKEFLNAIIEKY